MAISLRAKVLIGIALVCAGYVVFMPEQETVEPKQAASGERQESKPSPKRRAAQMVKAAFVSTDRIASSSLASSLFHVQSWYVAPPPPPPPPPAAYVPPPPPTAPPLPFAFMGSYKAQDGASTYYLMAGEKVFDVKVGDVLENNYSVDGVKAGQLLLTYMPLKIQQTLAVGDE